MKNVTYPIERGKAPSLFDCTHNFVKLDKKPKNEKK